MGQRTQLVLKTKDRFGTVQNKVYHEQWGYAKTMPMIILEFLISLNYGSNGQKKYLETYRKPHIVSLKELNAMGKEELEDTVKRLQDTSIHNLKLNSHDISKEYFSEEYGKRYVHKTEDGKEVIINDTNYQISKEDIPILEWDFDINNTENVRQFTGDNNDGLALISVEEKSFKNEYGNRDIKYIITVGFLVSDWYPIRRNSDKIDVVAVNRYHDLFSYTKRDEYYCPKPVMNAIAELYEYFDVIQLGKPVKEVAQV